MAFFGNIWYSGSFYYDTDRLFLFLHMETLANCMHKAPLNTLIKQQKLGYDVILNFDVKMEQRIYIKFVYIA